MPESSCKVVSEMIRREPWIKTLAIVIFKNYFESDIVNNLLQCMPPEISNLVLDLKIVSDTDAVNWNIHNPQFVIIIADELNKARMGFIL